MNTISITILGCGSSGGVPLIGCGCAVCRSDNPKNTRSRVSILVETQGKKILIDTSPDLRQQLLRHKISVLDAILYTHAHADHLHGIDDLRAVNYNLGAAIPAFMDERTGDEIEARFGYTFKPPIPEFGWFRPCLQKHIITAGQPFVAAGVDVQPFRQIHGKIDSLGFRIGNVAYSTDVNAFPPESEPFLEGLDLWIVDCLKEGNIAPSHAVLEVALGWIAKYKPKRAILTHLAHELDYDLLSAKLPASVQVAFDGMIIKL
jgi:phosphoribosyl 1,2-cyclic phosphate phosphodiesterase